MNKTQSFKYFKYEYKRNLKMLLYMGAIGFLLYLLPLLSLEPKYSNTSNVGIIITIFALASYIMPIFMNKYRYNKKLANRNFSSPISRRALFNVNFLIGLINIIVFYTIFYFLGMLIVAIKMTNYAIKFYIPLYFVILLIGICIYTFNYFIASRANKALDAFIFIIMYTFIFALLVKFIETLFLTNHEINRKFITFKEFVIWGNAFNKCIVKNVSLVIVHANEPSLYSIIGNSVQVSDCIITFVVLPILAITSYLLSYIMSNKESAEKVEEISDSYFGYKVLIPTYMLLSIVLTSVNIQSRTLVTLVYMGIFTALYFALTFICYRRFKIPKKDFIIYVSIVLVGTLLSLIILKFLPSTTIKDTFETAQDVILPFMILR